MATNQHLRHALHTDLPVPAGTKSGDPVKVGALVGVAITDRGDGGNTATHATVWRDGSWHLTVDGAVTEVGTPVYITADGDLVVTATDNTLFGYALETKSAAAGPIPVAIAQV